MDELTLEPWNPHSQFVLGFCKKKYFVTFSLLFSSQSGSAVKKGELEDGLCFEVKLILLVIITIFQHEGKDPSNSSKKT